MAVEFRVLGDIEAFADGRLVDVGHPRQRSVLTVLLIEANRVVTVDQLVERIWGTALAPRDPPSVLRTYLWHLRRALALGGEVALVRRAPGYKMVVDERQVDLHRFRDLLARTETASDDDQAAALIEQALGLWRGQPFAGLDTPWINTVRQNLLLKRQTARLDLTDIRLRRGHHAALLAELTDQAADHPLDERVAGQLMLALYRGGRPADALIHYRRVREQLVAELGTDPGPALSQLHQQILAADPALAGPALSHVPAPPPRPTAIPRQLPAAPRLFTGRDRELARLSTALDQASANGPTLVISSIGGPGGIGKTWLALHWAHQNLDRFPDGQLHVNLRGFGPAGEPMPVQVALRGFLDALDVAPAAQPADLDAQVGLYRSLLAGKRMLIVLDNARDTGQVTPLLPGTGTCTVLVTSRRRLDGLVAAHGAYTLDLDALADSEARQVLARHLGQERIAAQPQAAAELVAHCAGLPLALSIVATRAARHAEFPLAVFAADLRDQARWLDTWDADDPRTTLRAVLSWSTHALSLQAISAFGLLALAPGADISLSAAASLLALPESATRTLLTELEDSSLIQQPAPGRYRMHDLVRNYATDHAEQHHSPADRQVAVRRVLDFYTHTSRAADRLLNPYRSPIPLDPPIPGTHPQELADAAAAMAWLEAEHPNLMAAQRVAVSNAWHLTVWQLAWPMTTFHHRRGRLNDDLEVWRAAVQAADNLPDPKIRIRVHRFLGRDYADLGRHEEAIENLQQALVLAGHHHDLASQAHTHLELAQAWGRRGDDRCALEHATQALDLYRPLKQQVWEADALNAMGWYAARVDDYEAAHAHCVTALLLYRRHRASEGEAGTLDSLGYIEYRTGDHQSAIDHYQLALNLRRNLGNNHGCANTLDHLGHPHAALGQLEQARAVWREALELYRAQGRDSDAERLERQLDTLGKQAS